VTFLTLLASAIYLLPIVSFTALRCRKGSSLWQLATDVPLAVALDLLGVMLLARFMTLGWASLVSRGLWILGLATFAVLRAKKRDFPARPRELDRKLVVGVLFQSAVALLCSQTISRRTDIWDRDWHVPLTASLRGQRLPFGNVYEPRVELAYHYAGDLLASMLQTFSGAAMHASLALSLAHDLMFVLLAVAVAFTLAAVGIRRVAVQFSVLAAIVFAGPMIFAQTPREAGGGGYAFVGSLISLSFRPHVSLAYVLIVGFSAALLAGVHRSTVDVRNRVYPTLLATSAALVLTDETTLVLLGLWIGVVWLFDPQSLADTRLRGALRLVALLAAIGATISLFGGSLGLHAKRYPMWLVAPRAPSYGHTPVPLTETLGRSWLAQDLFSIFGVFLAAVGIALTTRRRETRVVAVSFLAIVIAATLGFTCLDFNHTIIENHRFVTLPYMFAPFLGAFMLAEPKLLRAPRREAGFAALLIYVSCGLAAASTIDWFWGGSGYQLLGTQYIGRHLRYSLNCRELTGAKLFERTTPVYTEDRGSYLWAGCHPTFVAGPKGAIDGHYIKTGAIASGPAALQELFQNAIEPDAPLSVACLAEGRHDAICNVARSEGVGACTSSGSEFTRCTVPSSQRERLLRR